MKWLCVLAVAAVAALTANAAEVAGVWKGSFESQNGTVEMTITIQPGPGLVGTVKSEMFGEAAIEKGKRDGDRVSFEIETSYGRVAFEGASAGDQLELNVTGTQGAKYQLNCKRQK